MMYLAIRVAVGAAIMIAFYMTRGFGSKLETFVMAFGASLAAQAVALGIKLLVGDQPRNTRAVLLLAASVIAVAGSVVFVVIDKDAVEQRIAVRGRLDKRTLQRSGDAYQFTIVDGDRRIAIRYRGTLSDQVRDRNEIVAQGQWQGDVFVATDVLAKCPTSYPTPSGPPPAPAYR